MNLNQCKTWLHSHPDVMIDLVRVYVGVALFFKGIYFIANREELLQIMERAGSWAIAPMVLAHYIVPAHLVGGVLLALGLATRAAAIAQLPILIGAVAYVHLPELTLMGAEPRQNLELSALVMFLTLLVALYGPGRFSIDAVIAKPAHGGLSSASHPA